jgi:DNA transformation protein
VKNTDRKISDLKNIGPKSAALLATVGITTEHDLRQQGSVAVYKTAKQRYPGNVSLNLLWALEASLMDFDWRELPTEIKESLKREL